MQFTDLAIIGTGPAGLSAAVNAASEGLSVVAIGDDLGGQIRRTSALENFIGYEKLCGRTFIARAVQSARRFGTDIHTERIRNVWEDQSSRYGRVFVLDGQNHSYVARSVIVAAGLTPRRIEAVDALGLPVHYLPGADDVQDSSIGVIGAGNSAGQYALHQTENGRKVRIYCRRDSLTYSMSQYLIERIENNPHIEVLFNASVGDVNGCDCVAVFAGSIPSTFGSTVKRNDNGYIVADAHGRTNVPGVFAAGDIVADSTKRVSNAVGTGAVAVSSVHQYLS